MASYKVTLIQKVLIPNRKKPEDIERVFTVQANSMRGAELNVKNAGHKGKIIRIERR